MLCASGTQRYSDYLCGFLFPYQPVFPCHFHRFGIADIRNGNNLIGLLMGKSKVVEQPSRFRSKHTSPVFFENMVAHFKLVHTIHFLRNQTSLTDGIYRKVMNVERRKG